MADTKYRLDVEATRNLDQLYEYGFHLWGERQADSYYTELLSKLDEIGEYPAQYPMVDHLEPMDKLRKAIFPVLLPS